MKKNIWFNRWFNNAYYFINLINCSKEFTIYGTNPNENTIIKLVCDYFELEPVLLGNDYIDYCIDFCIKNHIDVFVPYHNLQLISENIFRFEEVGTKVLTLEDSNLLNTIMDKAKLYEYCREFNLFNIPEYYIVTNVNQFEEAYKKLTSNNNRVCMKPVNSAGGSGFRVISEAAGTINNLLGPINHKITYDEVYKILSKQTSFEALMIMEYLDGYEYSIDCLAYDGKLLAAVPRKKVDSRVRALENIPELIELAKKTEDLLKIPYIFNIQVKYKNGIPKLLEINPRMSGGLNATCFSGINFPYIAIKLILGEDVNIPSPILNVSTTKIENRFILQENL
jgi:biotin carboxylase